MALPLGFQRQGHFLKNFNFEILILKGEWSKLGHSLYISNFTYFSGFRRSGVFRRGEGSTGALDDHGIPSIDSREKVLKFFPAKFSKMK